MSLQKIEINIETGEETIKDLTKAELSQIEEELEFIEAKKAANQAAKAALEAKKQEVLVKLGLTIEEMDVLLA
jgi:hypothetical protein